MSVRKNLEFVDEAEKENPGRYNRKAIMHCPKCKIGVEPKEKEDGKVHHCPICGNDFERCLKFEAQEYGCQYYKYGYCVATKCKFSEEQNPHKMKLITKTVAKKLKPLYETDGIDKTKIKVPLKLFNPVGAGTWYIWEYDPEKELAFGYANLGDDEMAEMGYISIKELREINLPMGLGIERDIHWDTNTTVQDVLDKKAT